MFHEGNFSFWSGIVFLVSLPRVTTELAVRFLFKLGQLLPGNQIIYFQNMHHQAAL